MNSFHPKLKIVSMAVAVAITGIIAGCNNDGGSSEQTIVKDDTYYKSLAETMHVKAPVELSLDAVPFP